MLFANLSRVIAPTQTAPAAMEGQAVVLARNAIAAARSVTSRVRAPRRPEEEAVQEATAVAGEATVVLGAGAVAAVAAAAVVVVVAAKKHGALSHVSCRVARVVLILLVFGFFFFQVTLAAE
jgi:hypothetical protein